MRLANHSYIHCEVESSEELGEGCDTINNHHNGVELFGLWEMDHEVHQNAFSTLSRNRQWS